MIASHLILPFGVGVLVAVLLFVEVSLWRQPLIKRHDRNDRNGGR